MMEADEDNLDATSAGANSEGAAASAEKPETPAAGGQDQQGETEQDEPKSAEVTIVEHQSEEQADMYD
jgi:hypothetical protein